MEKERPRPPRVLPQHASAYKTLTRLNAMERASRTHGGTVHADHVRKPGSAIFASGKKKERSSEEDNAPKPSWGPGQDMGMRICAPCRSIRSIWRICYLSPASGRGKQPSPIR